MMGGARHTLAGLAKQGSATPAAIAVGAATLAGGSTGHTAYMCSKSNGCIPGEQPGTALG